MTLLQLKYFCTACELGSVTKGAEKMFVTQPAITAAIRELEKEYHLCLLDRSGKNMVLTAEGEQFYQRASLLLQKVREFDLNIHELADRKRYVRLGMTKSVGCEVYTEYFPYGIRMHPKIDIVTHSGSSSTLLKELREHRLHVVLVPTQAADSMEDLECIPLKSLDMLYCVSENHPLAKEELITIPMIVSEKMVSTCNDQNKEYALKRMFVKAGYNQGPRVIQRFEQLTTALNMIRANVGTGYFPDGVVQKYEGIIGKKIEGDPPIHVYAVWTKDSWRKDEVQVVVKTMKMYYEKIRLH